MTSTIVGARTLRRVFPFSDDDSGPPLAASLIPNEYEYEYANEPHDKLPL